MAYELYITRAPHWSANQGHKIARAEWDLLVASDPTLLPDTPDDDAPPAHVTWRHSPDAPATTFSYDLGNILCPNPDEPALAKLLALARLLHAHLQGQHGEIYTSTHERPQLPQASLFERAAWHLRIRFPQLYQPAIPQAPADLAPQPESQDPSAPRPAPRRMTIPFPDSARPPSPAILSLLKPALIRAS